MYEEDSPLTLYVLPLYGHYYIYCQYIPSVIYRNMFASESILWFACNTSIVNKQNNKNYFKCYDIKNIERIPNLDCKDKEGRKPHAG